MICLIQESLLESNGARASRPTQEAAYPAKQDNGDVRFMSQFCVLEKLHGTFLLKAVEITF